MRADRLLKLADFLETVPPKAFYIESWVKSGADKPEGGKPGDCGFAGCAIGWAAHAKLFDGLELEGRYPMYNGAGGFDAIISLFEFNLESDREADADTHLFYFSSYPKPHNPTPHDVATRIREFISTEWAVP